MNEAKIDIRLLSLKELEDFFKSINEKAFRAKQVYEWLWKKQIQSFDDMTSISVSIREMLKTNFSFNIIKINQEQISSDKTIKVSFQLDDDLLVEGVLIPKENRATACISTQAGCALGCKFCATGTIKFQRDLSTSEIFDQVVILRRMAKDKYGLALTNIVIMGMGEPLLNYQNVIKAIDYITSKDGLEMSPQRITLSTSGITSKIKQLANEGAKFNLAISLHTANDIKRTSIMPINKTENLEKLKEALIYYHQKTGNRITFEYLLLNNFNDSLSDAKELAIYCRNFPTKINIIEYNETENSLFNKSLPNKIAIFVDYLNSKNMIVNIRKSRGEDIAAACGQLVNKCQISKK